MAPARPGPDDGDAGPSGGFRLPSGGIDRRNAEGMLSVCARPAPASATPAVRATAQLDNLTGPDVQLNGHLGHAIALDGDTLAAATLRSSNVAPRPSVTLFTASGSAWQQQAVLLPPAADVSRSFGDQLALLGDTLVVGAPNDDGSAAPGAQMGHVYVYARDGASSWQLQATLTAQQPADWDGFGSSLALAPELLAVGAVSSTGGAVEVFERTSNGWQRQQVLSAIEALPRYGFGTSLALDGDTLAVGVMSGVDDPQQAIHVFVRTRDQQFTPQAIVRPDRPTRLLGLNVSLRGDTLVAGDPYLRPSEQEPERGGVYVFERDCSGHFQQRALLTPPPEAVAGDFGRVSLIDADRLVIADPEDATHASGIDGPIGATLDDDSYGGAIYVFSRTAQGYTQQSFIKAPPPSLRERYFGWALTTSQGRVIAGSRADARLYVFD